MQGSSTISAVQPVSGILGGFLGSLYPNGDIKSVSENFLFETREGTREWLNEPILAFVHPVFHPALGKAFEQVFQGESAEILGVTCRLKCGSHRTFDLGLVPRKLGGEIRDVLMFGRRADQQPLQVVPPTPPPAQEELGRFLEQLLANAPVGFAFLSRALRFTCVNDAMARMNGYAAEQHLGRTVEEILPASSAKVLSAVHQVVNTGLPICDLEVSMSDERSAVLSFYPVRLSDGALLGVGIIGVDITDRCKMEEQLRRTARDLARSNGDLQRFAYMASHDLQEPLRMISSYVSLLREKNEGTLDEDSRHSFDSFLMARPECGRSSWTCSNILT